MPRQVRRSDSGRQDKMSRLDRTLIVVAGLLLPIASEAQTASRAVLEKYCVVCHNQRAKTAGLMLDTLDLDQVGSQAQIWEKVVRKIRTGAMPPAGMPRPDKPIADSTALWLEDKLDRAAIEHPNPGSPTLHRLNRAEYHNAIRDLLALDIDAASLLPADSAGYGFDNNADALTLSGALTERYLETAAKISGMLLGRARSAPPPDTVLVPTDRDAFRRFSDDLPWGSRGGTAFQYYFPVNGEYEFQIRLRQVGVAGDILGITADPFEVDVSFDKTRVWTTTVGGPEFMKLRAGELRDKKVLDTLHFKVPGEAGAHLVQAYFVSKSQAFVEDLFDPYSRREPYRGVGPPEIQSVTIAAPPADAADVDTPSRRRLFVCHPASPAEEVPCAEKIIATLARRAYRRPVSAADLKAPLTLYKEGAQKGGFEAGVELAVRGILVSPNFLFRFEGQPEALAANMPYRISDLELASRLSFFLWSSIPDDELVQIAAKNALHNPAVLDQQVRRMLADARSEALVQNFAGQWLHIRNVPGFHPSPELLFHFDDNLRLAFERETEMFFESIVRENRSVLDLLDADYTFLNERLARHYGIPDVYGERFRRVPLPAESARRGLLGQGSILTDTSRPNRTSPVLRGKWILREYFRSATTRASRQRARPSRRKGSAQGASHARADGAASGQSRLRGLPRADGSTRVRARKF